MLNSRLEKLAMEQMEKMSPDQLAQIERQIGSLGPGAMERVCEKLAAMTESDIENIEQKMLNSDPSTFSATSSTLRARHAHVYQVSLGLKNEGNGLFREGNFAQACEKYNKAKSNLSMLLDQESHDLMIICSLNLANCYLKLELHNQCIEECSEVLKNQPENKKALFRRGQALIGQKQLKKGLEDLKHALELSEGDLVEQKHIQKKVQEVEDQLSKSQSPIEQTPSPSCSEVLRKCSELTGLDTSPEMVKSGVKAMSKLDSETLAKMPALAEKLNLRTPVGNPDSSTLRKPDFSLTPENLPVLSEVFKNNPQLIQEQAKRLSKMTQEDLDRIAKLTGAPTGLKITPETAQKATELFQKMDPDQFEQLPKMAASQTSNPSPAQAMEVLSSLDETSIADMLVTTGACKDPIMANKISKQVKKLNPQQMQRLIRLQQVTSNGAGLMRNLARKLASREALMIAIMILILAVVLRQFGY